MFSPLAELRGWTSLPQVYAKLEKWAETPEVQGRTGWAACFFAENEPAFDASLENWAETKAADLVGNVNDYFARAAPGTRDRGYRYCDNGSKVTIDRNLYQML